MITLRPGSQVLKLLAILSYLGEIPMSALRLIGSENTLRPLVQKLTQMQLYGAIVGKAYYTGAISLKQAIEVSK